MPLNRKTLAIVLAMVLTVTALAGCSSPRTGNTGKVKVIATIFPQYDFTRQIAGDKAEVILLLPPGTESHVFEPKPEDIIAIHSSDLFIYTGEYMEPWAGRVIAGIDTQKVLVVDASMGITLHQGTHEHEDDHEDDEDHEDEEHHEHEEDHAYEEGHVHEEGHEDGEGHVHAYDPHLWLDPTLAMFMVDNITTALCEKDPVNADFYRQNAGSYKQELDLLDRDFQAVVQTGQRKTIVFGGRFAFAYLVERYGLKYEGAYDSCSTEAEPSVQTIAGLISFTEKNAIPVIYHEELVDPKVARSISEQTGAKLMLMHTAHNVTKAELARGISYLDIMRSNLANLKEGLN